MLFFFQVILLLLLFFSFLFLPLPKDNRFVSDHECACFLWHEGSPVMVNRESAPAVAMRRNHRLSELQHFYINICT